MAINVFTGQATAVAQVSTASIDSVDGTPANNTFTVTIGGVAISVAGVTDVAATATALRAALNASTHPYFSSITWSGSSGNIIGTADNAGEPFVAALTKTGAGTGTVTTFAATVASAGPNDWSTAGNWTLGTVPATTNEVMIDASSVAIRWGLDQSGMAGSFNTARVTKSATGLIGLSSRAFLVAGQENTSFPEYRETFLKIKTAILEIGESLGGGNADGSRRIKIDTGTTAATIRVFASANSSSETGLSPIRLRATHANTDLFILGGNVGVATDSATDTATLRKISLTGGSVVTGYGLTLTTFEQFAGAASTLRLAATLTTLTIESGSLTHEGTAAVTTANVRGGTLLSNSTGIIATLNMTGGTTDLSKSAQARTVTNATLDPGAQISYDPAVVTLTNKVTSSRRVTLAAA